MPKKTPEELAKIAVESKKAMDDYVADADAQRKRTAVLREQRLARDAAEASPKPKASKGQTARVGKQKFFKGNPEAGSVQ
jgi:hypothetical protein